MDSLKDISCETIRQTWTEHKDEMANSPYYEILWDSLEKKFNLDTSDMYLRIFKKFINNEEINFSKPLFNQIYITQINSNTLEFKGLDNDQRKNIHLLCDKIGLHHESKTHPKKNKRFLYIYKPNIWLWEYTIKNPYSKSDEFYAQREVQRQINQNKMKEKLSKRYCCICETNGWDTDLFCSVYIRGLYCSDCLETESDGDGGVLNDHKFEPL